MGLSVLLLLGWRLSPNALQACDEIRLSGNLQKQALVVPKGVVTASSVTAC